jgi:hypothetical protein
VKIKQHNNNNQEDNSGVYSLKCKDCPLHYIGQTGLAFKTWFNEHTRALKHNQDTSPCAQHIINIGHTYGNMQDTIEIIQIARWGRYMNITEKYHIFCIQKQNKQMNKLLFDLNNPIFEAVYIHYITQQHKHFNIHTVDSTTILSQTHVNLVTCNISTT